MGRDLQQEDHIIIWGLTGFIVIVVGFYISQPHVQPTSIQPVGQKVKGDQGNNDNTPAQPPGNNLVRLPPVPERPQEPAPEPPALPEIPKSEPPALTLTSFPHSGGSPSSGGAGEVIEFTYSLNLFEGTQESDGAIDLGQEVRAVAFTDDPSVVKVIFRWKDPSAVSAQTTETPPAPAQDTFKPGQPGPWEVVADFGNGKEVHKPLDVKFLVIPESGLGAIVLIGSSLAALGAYVSFMKLRQKRSERGVLGDLSF